MKHEAEGDLLRRVCQLGMFSVFRLPLLFPASLLEGFVVRRLGKVMFAYYRGAVCCLMDQVVFDLPGIVRILFLTGIWGANQSSVSLKEGLTGWLSLGRG